MQKRDASGTVGNGKRMPYGTAPIELNLADAIDLTVKIGKEGPSVSLTTLAILAGHTVTSSATTRKISALQTYGLLEKQGPEEYALTDRGKSIAFPRSVQAAMEAKKEAFLNVGKYSTVYQQHKGKLLPADEFLKNIFEQDGKIPREYAERWVEAFKSGASAAGLLLDRGGGRIQISDSPIVQTEAPPVETQKPNVEPEPTRADYLSESSLAQSQPFRQGTGFSLVGASGHCTRIELSTGERAEFWIPDKLTNRDAQKLKKALEGVKSIIDSMVADEEIPSA